MLDVELVPDARNLMESTRAIGYSLPAAVADLIDNCIAADAHTVSVETPAENAVRLMILDDGCGMDADELRQAMRYGSSFVGEDRAENDLGRFGLGLKVASLSQCRRLTVLSKRRGGVVAGARWDLDHVAASEKAWALQILEEDDLKTVPWAERLQAQENGTLVVWENLDVLMMGVKHTGRGSAIHTRVAELKRHLALVFHRFLEGDAEQPFTILFNGSPLEPLDPFLRGRSQPPFAPDSFDFHGVRIRVEPFILPHPSKMTSAELEQVGDMQKDQGFYVYRNKRLVIWGTWFRLGRKLPLSKLARVLIDIPASTEIDHLWSLDVKKSSALIPEELRGPFRSVVERLTHRSGNVWTQRTRQDRAVEELWVREKVDDGTVRYVINENCALVRDCVSRNPALRPLLRLLSAKLPLDAIYADLSSEKVIDTKDEDLPELFEALRKAGLNPSDYEFLS